MAKRRVEESEVDDILGLDREDDVLSVDVDDEEDESEEESSDEAPYFSLEEEEGDGEPEEDDELTQEDLRAHARSRQKKPEADPLAAEREAMVEATRLQTEHFAQSDRIRQAKDLLSKTEQDIAALRAKYKTAVEEGDAEETLSLTEQLFEKRTMQDRLKEFVNQPVAPPPDPKALAWSKRNPWFGKNPMMTAYTQAYHAMLVNAGVDPRTEQYYQALDQEVRKRFPEEFSGKKVPPKGAAPVNRGGGGPSPSKTKKDAGVVRLTPLERAMAKKLGVPLKEYARYVSSR